MAIMDMRETKTPQRKGLFIPEHKIKRVEAQMKTEILEELESSGQIIISEDEMAEKITEAVKVTSDKISEKLGFDIKSYDKRTMTVVTDEELKIAEDKMTDAIIDEINEDFTIVSDSQLELAETKMRDIIITEAELVIDNILEEKIGMDFDTLSDINETLYVIDEKDLLTVEAKMKESIQTEIAENLNISVETLDEDGLNVLSDADFEKLEEAFIAKIAESLNMTSDALNEKLTATSDKPEINEAVKEKSWAEEKDAPVNAGLFESLIDKTNKELKEHSETSEGTNSPTSLMESLIDTAISDKAPSITEKSILNSLVS